MEEIKEAQSLNVLEGID